MEQRASTSAGLSTMLAVMALSSLAVAAFFWFIGHFRLTRLLELMPYPVICGFMAGIGWLLLEAGIGVVIDAPIAQFREAIGAIMRGLSDNASVMRETAQTITRVTADASSRAGTAADASEQASHNVTAVAGAAEELSASVEEIGRQVRQSAGAVEQTSQRTEKSIAEKSVVRL